MNTKEGPLSQAFKAGFDSKPEPPKPLTEMQSNLSAVINSLHEAKIRASESQKSGVEFYMTFISSS
jgi:hypothetical protein